MTTCPYWPRPPVCRMNFPSMYSTRLRTVSRYATCGRPTLASTLNSRRIRSTMISRCSSPMPLMIVCEVSASVCTRNVGSSSDSFASAMPCLSWSALVLGSMATEMTGFGKRIASRMIGCDSSHSVSPVRVSLRPIAAAMSPARTSSISSRLLACICSRRPMRSLRSLVLFEILVQDRVVAFDARFDHFVSQLRDLLLERGGDGPFDVLLSHRLVVIHDLDLTHEVDESRKQLT